eukprot:TRINITY_DN5178_c0_g1_i4.p3 TRINITY_DN5178_c0_g1~~TRINITY_DN5178_c0_g1_i4.p3  ORF type:complete len:102 (-),score=17.24 TRINITY_DN5178_c0_g1_i4:270-575(-)
MRRTLFGSGAADVSAQTQPCLPSQRSDRKRQTPLLALHTSSSHGACSTDVLPEATALTSAPAAAAALLRSGALKRPGAALLCKLETGHAAHPSHRRRSHLD